jgi:periplasmic protein TonB
MNNSAPVLTNPSTVSSGDSLLLALFIAAVLHVVVLLGVNFSAPKTIKINKAIEITLSHEPLKTAPREAKLLAPDHQLGAGESTVKGEPLKDQPTATVRETLNPGKKAMPSPKPQTKNPMAAKVLSQPVAEAKLVAPPPQPEQPTELAEDRPKLTAEALQEQIAQLGERIRTSQQSSEESKIKFVNSVSTHKFLAAQYEKDWVDKVERTGNLNYPEAARHKGASQTLTMDVGINADGSIYSMRIVKSSGNPRLDEAAKHIVKMSAPFAELPNELLSEVKVLVIPRVWKFSDESGMTAR